MNYECEKCGCPMAENEVVCPICGHIKSGGQNHQANDVSAQNDAVQNQFNQNEVQTTREFGSKQNINMGAYGQPQNPNNMAPQQNYSYQQMPPQGQPIQAQQPPQAAQPVQQQPAQPQQPQQPIQQQQSVQQPVQQVQPQRQPMQQQGQPQNPQQSAIQPTQHIPHQGQPSGQQMGNVQQQRPPAQSKMPNGQQIPNTPQYERPQQMQGQPAQRPQQMPGGQMQQHGRPEGYQQLQQFQGHPQQPHPQQQQQPGYNMQGQNRGDMRPLKPTPLKPIQDRNQNRNSQTQTIPNMRADMGMTGILELEAEEKTKKTKKKLFGKGEQETPTAGMPQQGGHDDSDDDKPKSVKSIIITVLIFVGVAVLGVLAAIFVVSPLLGGSTEDQDNPYSEYIIGSWLSDEFTYTENSGQNMVEYLTFGEDGTFTLKYLVPNDSDPKGYETGSWQTESTISGTVSVDVENKRLVLHYTEGENNYYYDRIFVTRNDTEMVLREYYDSTQTSYYDMRFTKVSGATVSPEATTTPETQDAA